MSNNMRSEKDVKDVFHAYLVKNADFSGYYEMPKTEYCKEIPSGLISFSKAMYKDDFNSFVHFYEHDYKYEKLWNRPEKYISRLKKFKGVISPDFSLYRDMPLAMQIWNNYRNRVLCYYFSANGIDVIPNVRFSDERSYEFCFEGIGKEGVISVGTHGCIKRKEDKEYFKKGIDETIRRLSPKTIVVYGSVNNNIFENCIKSGVKILPFESEFSLSRKKVDSHGIG